MVDEIEHVDGSIIQHGPYNDRIYVMHVAPGDPNQLIPKLDHLALVHGYGKILVKIPADYAQYFLAASYVEEANIPGLFRGKVDCFFVSKFFKNRQKTSENFTKLRSIAGKDNNLTTGCSSKSNIHTIDVCTRADAQELSMLYQDVFPSYPFPITDPSYLSRAMDKEVRYYCIRSGNSIIAAAAIEPDYHGQYAELTDFATLPEWRGRRLAEILLRHMNAVIDGSRIKTVYTIARASSYGMNRVFWKCGFTYSGLLLNNTQISGSIQSMSVWYKHVEMK